MNSGTPPGGLLGTADACPEPLPYQDPSARRFATALMLSICVSAPVFLLQSAVQSVCVSLPLALSLKTPPYQTKNPSQKAAGSIGASLNSHGSRLAGCSCL